MKTQFITLTLLLSVLFTVNSQNGKNKTGLKLGYNLAAVSLDDESETGQRHAFHIGFYTESFASEDFSIQLELLYSQQGYEINDNGGTFTQKLDYLNLPIMLKLYPNANFFLEAGPQIGLAVSHKETFDDSFNLFDTSEEFNPSNFDWGVNFGGGFKTDSGVSFGVRYHLGLGDVYDEGKPKNRVWHFSLGFDF